MSSDNTRALRAAATVEARVSAAYRDGYATAAAGEPRVVPWPADGGAVDRLLARVWAKGYTAGHGFDTLID